MLPINDHVPEQMIELYALGRLAEGFVRLLLEEHLLVCAKCQEALREEDVFSRTLPSPDSSCDQNSCQVDRELHGRCFVEAVRR